MALRPVESRQHERLKQASHYHWVSLTSRNAAARRMRCGHSSDSGAMRSAELKHKSTAVQEGGASCAQAAFFLRFCDA